MSAKPRVESHLSARLCSVVVAAGAIVMALEILSIRILSPTFGNSVYVWGSVISVFLAALALGAVLGGRLADRRPSLRILGRCFLLAGAFQVALLLWALPFTTWIGRITGGSPIGPLVAASFLFGPATVALATVAPFAVRLTARRLDQLGWLTGRLYALSTAGSLAGTLICTFLLIPFLDLDAILGLLLTATGLAALTTVRPRSAGDRGAATVTPLALLLVVVWPLTGLVRNELVGDVIERRLTPYQTLEVVERDGRRTLLSDGRLQSSVELVSGEPALHYPRHAIAALLFSRPQRALVLGLGGGSVASYLSRALPDLEVESVEVDPVVVEIARRHFDFKTDWPDRVHTEDARAFLAGSDQSWDLIVCDTYIGLSIPFHLATREFFLTARERLSPDGTLLVNLAGGLDQPFSRAILATVSSVFRQVYALDVTGAKNVLLIARDEPERLSNGELAERARRLDLDHEYRPSFDQVLANFFEPAPEARLADVLVDRFAPVDRLLRDGRALEAAR